MSSRLNYRSAEFQKRLLCTISVSSDRFSHRLSLLAMADYSFGNQATAPTGYRNTLNVGRRATYDERQTVP